ncbi:MAG: 50S ribosomal protein L4, partial [Actinobacteria bacterium]|nr:50S ribosomal protein L4 [Actinomycetota bacterium]
VSMTVAKAFRQKGTGRARAGALSTPQRTGGGIAFGPKPRGYAVKVNRKARRRALRSALSLHAGRGSLGVVDIGQFDTPATKQAGAALGAFGEGRALVLLSRDGEETCAKSFRNLRGVEVMPADAAGVADIVGASRLVVSQAAIERLTAMARVPERRSAEPAGAAA